MSEKYRTIVPDPPTDSKPGKMGGAECFAGTRIPVAQIRALVKRGMSSPDVCRWYPDLTPEWVAAALLAEREDDQ